MADEKTQTPQPEMVTVQFGPKSEQMSPGTTIGDAAKKMKVPMGLLTRKPIVYLNGSAVTDFRRVLKAGDRVEFSKAAGRKG